MAVTKAVFVPWARPIVIHLGDADGRRSTKEVAVSHGLIPQCDGENTGLTRAGSPQHCGAGEGQVQHARVGEEVEQPLNIPGVIPGSFYHLRQGELWVIFKHVVDVIIKCIFLAHRDGGVLDLTNLLI